MPDSESKQVIIQVCDLVSGYGQKQILNSVSLYVGAGEVVTVIGHNGAGKSTLLKAIFGLTPVWSGRVEIDGSEVRKWNPRDLLRRGIAYIPQGSRVFTDLTVQENLDIVGTGLGNSSPSTAGLDKVLSLFPALRPRLRDRAGELSGGERQMLALAGLSLLSPRVMLLDEPSLGLSPALTTETLGRIREFAHQSGTSVLIVEQRVREVLKIADRVYSLRVGTVSFSGPADYLRDDAQLRAVYF